MRAREIYDSRGRPTLEAETCIGGRWLGCSSVPSGASVGRHEAVELRDADPLGLGSVARAVDNVSTLISAQIVGLDEGDQHELDRLLCDLDGTSDKSHLGANALLAVSISVCRAAAEVAGVPLYQYISSLTGCAAVLPTPMVNVISGGHHGGGNLDLQDWQVIPRMIHPFHIAMRQIVTLYAHLGNILQECGLGRTVGDEGGYAPYFDSNTSAFEVIDRAALSCKLPLGDCFDLALDVAASHLTVAERYVLREFPSGLDCEGLLALLESWLHAYPVVSVEDPIDQDDWSGWQMATARLSGCQIIGDDFIATNPGRLTRAIEMGCANAVLVKMNQIGTISETLEVIQIARQAGYRIVVSARSGETEDDFLADLAVGVGADLIKIGSVARSERLAKYNRLLRIAGELGEL